MWGPGIAALVCLYVFRKNHIRTVSFWGGNKMRSIAFYWLPILALVIPGLQEKQSGINPHLMPVIYGIIGFISIFGEELGWRGFLQDALTPIKSYKKFFLIAFLWELWHFRSNLYFNHAYRQEAIMILYVIVLSFIIGFAVERTRSLWVAVTLHTWADIGVEFDSVATYWVLGFAIPFWAFMIYYWPTSKKQASQANISATIQKSRETVAN